MRALVGNEGVTINGGEEAAYELQVILSKETGLGLEVEVHMISVGHAFGVRVVHYFLFVVEGNLCRHGWLDDV